MDNGEKKQAVLKHLRDNPTQTFSCAEMSEIVGFDASLSLNDLAKRKQDYVIKDNTARPHLYCAGTYTGELKTYTLAPREETDLTADASTVIDGIAAIVSKQNDTRDLLIEAADVLERLAKRLRAQA